MLDGWPPPILDPAGPYAWPVTILTWVLLATAASVLALVGVALWLALFGGDRARARVGGTRVIWLAGIALPVVVLSALLFYGLALTANLSDRIRGDELRVRITGEMWWWRVAYLDDRGEPLVHDANELHIPVGEPVVLELQSADVIHSFWVPRLSGKLDMVPGRKNLVRIQADEPGVFGGQCAEYCGGPHALMGFVVVAHPPEEFARLMGEWRTRETGGRPAGEGAELFQSAGCAACHRIAGTAANGLAGPDLTFVGSRRTLGAGILPNNRGTMMGWIGNSQAIKPNNRMPPYAVLSGRELQALATYLEAQK
jgi:cytochrome c oxidase subunit II